MDSTYKSKVFITGAGGFVGANLTRSLIKNNYSVHILNHSKNLSWRLSEISKLIHVHNGDITKFKSLRNVLNNVQPDYIIHLATYGAYHYQNELEKIINVNITGTKNLLESSKNIPYKCFINTGSSSEYGFKIKPMREKDCCDPVSYYGVTKLAATHICKVFAEINNKPIVTFRLFSVYGDYEEPGRFIPTIMKALKYKKAINLTPGDQRRDFIYIEDVANAFMQALKLGQKIKGEILNLGTAKEYTNDEVVDALFKVTNKITDVIKGTYPKRFWDTPHWCAEISHIYKKLNWKPEFTLDQGLQSTYTWFERDFSKYSNIYA